jgi:hypothetical protein
MTAYISFNHLTKHKMQELHQKLHEREYFRVNKNVKTIKSLSIQPNHVFHI